MSIRPAWLQRIAPNQVESDKLEAFVTVAHARTPNMTEHIGFAATSRARAGAPQQFELQKRFGAVVPGNGQLFADLLDISWLDAHVFQSRFVRVRSPKIAVPTRTSVAPSSTAIAKSCVMPVESWARSI